MSNRKEFLTKLRDRIAKPETNLIFGRYTDDDNCCVLGYAALEAGVSKDALRFGGNMTGILGREDLAVALRVKGLTFSELQTLQSVNDSSHYDTRKYEVLGYIDDLLKTTDET